MNFDKNDIERSNTYLLELHENGTLNLGEDRLGEFVNFIINTISIDSVNETLLLTIKTLAIAELKDLEEKFLKNGEFDEIISKSFQLEKRRQLKQKVIQLDLETAEVSIDEIIAKAFKTEKRKELKQKLKLLKFEAKSKEAKVISFNPYLKVISIAASLILIFLIWQPQHTSDKKLFANYLDNIEKSSTGDFTKAELVKEQTGLRGEEEHFKNYTNYETSRLIEAISLVKQKDFEKARVIFDTLHVEKEKNPGLALYLSIAQLNTDNLSDAIINLEYLTKLSGVSYRDETKFHLAFAYLKSGERKKAKELLQDLVRSKSKFAEQAQQALNKMRWF